VLALAGGVRQNTLFFLLPLWLFSVKKVQPGKIIASLLLLVTVCLSWFVPMVVMTGGWESYRLACKELWEFNTGHQTVFERGHRAFAYNLSLLATYTIYNLGGGSIMFGFAAYHIIRSARFRVFLKREAIFIWFWCLPAVLFYLLIFIHTNPGYALVLMPQFVILAALSADYVRPEFDRIFGSCSKVFVVIALFVNVLFFLLSKCPVSYAEIKLHDKSLEMMISNLGSFDPSTTVILVGPYKYYGYRQIMYYLPQYSVYQVDYRVSRDGEVRKTFWGKNRRTFLSDGIVLSTGIRKFAAVFYSDEKVRLSGINETRIQDLPPDLIVLSGPVEIITRVYPETATLVKLASIANKHRYGI
jgi:hypothetical protein